MSKPKSGRCLSDSDSEERRKVFTNTPLLGVAISALISADKSELGSMFEVNLNQAFRDGVSAIQLTEQGVNVMSKAEISKDKPNSVTDDLIVSRIQDVKFENVSFFGQRSVLCAIKMDNDFVVVSDFNAAVCIDDANFDQDIGQEYSYKNAYSKLWPLEGYRMMSDNHAQSKD